VVERSRLKFGAAIVASMIAGLALLASVDRGGGIALPIEIGITARDPVQRLPDLEFAATLAARHGAATSAALAFVQHLSRETADRERRCPLLVVASIVAAGGSPAAECVPPTEVHTDEPPTAVSPFPDEGWSEVVAAALLDEAWRRCADGLECLEPRDPRAPSSYRTRASRAAG
jgi:hypothetical protein